MEIQNQSFFELIIYTISACFTLIFGHNLWLVAKDEPDEIRIEVITSDKFPESDSAVRPERIRDFRVFSGNGWTEINDFQTAENSLVARLKNKKAQLATLELYPHPIVLEAEKFAGYIKSEDAETLVSPDFIKGETTKPQRESYAKFAKVLIKNESFESVVGHRLEIIPQMNPSDLKSDEKFPVKVLFDGKPLKNLRVSSGAENLGGGKYAAHSLTDENGLAKISVSGAGLWFVRTHFIRPHFDKDEFDWESFWASVTFRI